MKQILWILIFNASVCFAQNGFIEVEVRDTIHLVPTSYEYHLKVDYSDFMKYDEKGETNLEEAKQKLNQKLNEIEVLLSKNGYKFKSFSKSKFEINNPSYLSEYGYAVSISDKNELQPLVDILINVKGITGSIGNLDYQDEDKFEKALFIKLVNKAKIKAKTIAELSGLKLGKILEFKEVKEIDNMSYNLLDIYFTAARTKSWNMTNGSISGEMSKAIVIKFMAE